MTCPVCKLPIAVLAPTIAVNLGYRIAEIHAECIEDAKPDPVRVSDRLGQLFEPVEGAERREVPQ